MNDRSQAIDILRRARDMLAEQLTERVLASHHEILSEAMGLSYAGEIEAIYEQYGARLRQLSALLEGLPEISEPAADRHPQRSPPGSQKHAFRYPALPAPKPIAGLISTSSARFESFACQIQGGQIKPAGETLAPLLGLDVETSVSCARTFHGRMLNDPRLVLVVVDLEQELMRRSINRALLLLWECFGLVAPESVHVFNRLTSRLQTAES